MYTPLAHPSGDESMPYARTTDIVLRTFCASCRPDWFAFFGRHRVRAALAIQIPLASLHRVESPSLIGAGVFHVSPSTWRHPGHAPLCMLVRG